MHIVTCQVGGSLRLGEGARIVIHGRQGARIALGAAAPAGTDLILGGAAIQPVSGKDGVWHYLFSLFGCRRFQLGEYGIRFWLPGELIALAEDCSDWLHVGIDGPSLAALPEYRPPSGSRCDEGVSGPPVPLAPRARDDFALVAGAI